MYIQKSLPLRIADQLLFSVSEIAVIMLAQLLLFGYALLLQAKDTSQDVAQLSGFFEGEILSSISDTVSSAMSKIASADVATMVLWALVGAALYAAFLFGLTLLKGTKNTVASSFMYTHPEGSSSSSLFVYAVLEHVLQATIVFVFILYTSTIINSVIPHVFTQVRDNLQGSGLNYAWVALYLIAGALAWHVWVFLLRMVRGRYRHDISDL